MPGITTVSAVARASAPALGRMSNPDRRRDRAVGQSAGDHLVERRCRRRRWRWRTASARSPRRTRRRAAAAGRRRGARVHIGMFLTTVVILATMREARPVGRQCSGDARRRRQTHAAGPDPLGLGGGRGQLRRHPRRGRVPLGSRRDDDAAAPRVRLVARRGRVGDVGQHDAVRPDGPVRRRADGPVRRASRAVGGADAHRGRFGAERVHDDQLAAGAAVGRAGRCRHRVDLDGLRRDGGHAMVRNATRSGHRGAHRGERDGPADLPAGRCAGHRHTTAGAGRR